MTSINKILVVIDPTAASQPALDRIARLPRPLTAQIMLLICDYEATIGSGYAMPAEVVAATRTSALARHRARLEALAAPLIADGLDVQVDARWDYPLHEAIIRKAIEWNADLVVKDTHQHSVLRRSIFSNTDWSLIRHCPTRLLLVKRRTIGHIPCVVAAVDPLHPRDKGASLDDRIVASANELAHLFAGQSVLLHAFDVSPFLTTAAHGPTIPVALPVLDVTAQLEMSYTEAVRALAKKHGIPRERVHVLQGRTRELLISSTDELRADIVVMGAISRSAIERLFVGSTAEAVLDRLHCDVLIVKPVAFKSSIGLAERGGEAVATG
jgi:universal stress protein E